MNRKLTWLASYPKSGNTWTRLFLAAYRSVNLSDLKLEHVSWLTHSESRFEQFEAVSGKKREDLTEREINSLRRAVQKRLASQFPQGAFIKTHNARMRFHGFPLIHREFTNSAVYLVRNPLDVLDSMVDHNGCNVDQMIKWMNDPAYRLGISQGLATQYLDTWSTHVRSWTTNQAFPVLILRYEDLKARPIDTFRSLLQFLNWDVHEDKLKDSVEACHFQRVQQMESENGFNEISPQSQSGTFFRRGQSGSWMTVLTREQAETVLSHHSETMHLVGYKMPDLDRVYAKA